MYQNLFDFLFELYQKKQFFMDSATKASYLAVARGFVGFCKQQLQENPPVNTTVAESGFAFRLQDGQVLQLNSATPNENKFYEASISTTKSSQMPHEMPDSRVVNITGM
jgi:hypothetical protein